MNLTKEIITEIVSYIELSDIKEFVLTHPELVEKEENKSNTNTVIVTGIVILKAVKIAPNIYVSAEDLKGGEKYGKFE